MARGMRRAALRLQRDKRADKTEPCRAQSLHAYFLT